MTTCLTGGSQELVAPDVLYRSSGLFHDMQMSGVFDDSKTFPDSHPIGSPDDINGAYLYEVTSDPSFRTDPARLDKFYKNNYRPPKVVAETYEYSRRRPLGDHLRQMWDVLTFYTPEDQDSLIGLPGRYIKPGGRYREAYLSHDAPAAAIGLAAEGRYDLIEEMLDCCESMHQRDGFIRNGSRSYYERKQRPMAFMMVDLLADYKGRPDTLRRYRGLLESEFASWAAGTEFLSESNPTFQNVVRMPDGKVGFRYWSPRTTPRPEGYAEDTKAALEAGLWDGNPATLMGVTQDSRLQEFFQHAAAGAGAGTDFCGLWFADGKNYRTINTMDYIPADLNCLMKGLADLAAEACLADGDYNKAMHYAKWSSDLTDMLNTFCLDRKVGWYFNYNHKTRERKDIWGNANGGFALYFRVAPEEVHPKMVDNYGRFERIGGMLTTLDGVRTNWGGPKMWLHEVLYALGGLERIKGSAAFKARAKEKAANIRHRVLHNTVRPVYLETDGRTPENYDAEECGVGGVGGEYDTQMDGFAINNGPLEGIIHGAYNPFVWRRMGRMARQGSPLADGTRT